MGRVIFRAKLAKNVRQGPPPKNNIFRKFTVKFPAKGATRPGVVFWEILWIFFGLGISGHFHSKTARRNKRVACTLTETDENAPCEEVCLSGQRSRKNVPVCFRHFKKRQD